jgi:hypothetical protein
MNQTLCIDVGGTRIKSAVLPKNPSLDDLKAAESMSVRTLGWLNHSLPNLLKPDCWAGLADYYNRKQICYNHISISVPGPVDKEGCFLREDLTSGAAKCPKQLLHALKQASGKSVTIINDADAWILGFLRYADLIGESLTYPVLSIAFGTGIGTSMATDSKTIHSVEISSLESMIWKKLRKSAQRDFTNSWYVHGIIGRTFFEWVEKSHPEWDYPTIREQFSARVLAACEDLEPILKQRFGNTGTIVLAGGNAEFVSVSKLEKSLNCRVFSLTDRHTQLTPDLISLLGVEAATGQR